MCEMGIARRTVIASVEHGQDRRATRVFHTVGRAPSYRRRLNVRRPVSFVRMGMRLMMGMTPKMNPQDEPGGLRAGRGWVPRRKAAPV